MHASGGHCISVPVVPGKIGRCVGMQREGVERKKEEKKVGHGPKGETRWQAGEGCMCKRPQCVRFRERNVKSYKVEARAGQACYSCAPVVGRALEHSKRG